ncbi:MAG: hypothetical protein JWM18_1345 [Chloroflexi bacterium]|jgi:hypothetical protein|nr:hypothetical protein [Chloroflexota bacterium]
MEVLDTATATASGGREVFACHPACLPGALELIARQATLTVV